MESRKLQITLHSAKGVHNVKHFGTMDPYAVVWIAGDDKQSKPHKTKTAIKGASGPVWDHCMKFNVPSMHDNYTLFCDIKHDGKFFDRNIGDVQLPFRDLLAGDASGEKVSYPVKNSSGEIEGEIILSHKFTVESGGTGSKVPSKKVHTIKKKERKRRMKVVKQMGSVAVEGIMLAVNGKNGMTKWIVKKMVTKMADEALSVAEAWIMDALHKEDGNIDGDEDEDGDEDAEVGNGKNGTTKRTLKKMVKKIAVEALLVAEAWIMDAFSKDGNIDGDEDEDEDENGNEDEAVNGKNRMTKRTVKKMVKKMAVEALSVAEAWIMDGLRKDGSIDGDEYEDEDEDDDIDTDTDEEEDEDEMKY